MSLHRKSSPKGKFSAIFSVVLSLAIVGITLIALVSDRGWTQVLELLSHFRLQYFLLSLILLLLLFLTRRKVPILIALFCVALLSTPILPWYNPLSRSAAAAELRVLTANINTRNRSYEKVLTMVREEKPDIAVFLEVDDTWVAQLQNLKDILPYEFGQANPYNFGIAVYSRFPLANAAIDFFETDGNPSILANLTVEGQSISLVAAHPFPPVRRSFFHTRNLQLDRIGQYVQQLETPIVLLGDLNITMWSPYYKRFVRNTGLQNARRGFGVLPTWPMPGTYAVLPNLLHRLLQIPIDHCLVSSDIKVAAIHTGRDVDSDHLPLIADLVIP
ncbi:endonuclease/exonuclease/phosphatase family protein [Oculatella sp. FACHB-28]|uniref:endonuclease/exonuclease/phosphatase family protein n=1 Tax=Cyanophyceae TaxID=3028117 RepID=UPI00168937C9|nr:MULTISPECIES: endonuclease/exonuclease/phosphatase family protein [Cyanophyceae]MBD2058497.1 endonuclease/exonuclease/phosphatase family protein [Oculatella sp. FACHB-28]MBD2071762.1 endonuclease/exonuclease/phosphatase family protein [Leptolyngbya sp. FACHB-671]